MFSVLRYDNIFVRILAGGLMLNNLCFFYSLRSNTNIKYFPKIFACYFFLFHVYFFSFPFGFCYVALSATVCYVLHAMIHFWNVYEVPAFESGRISPVRPRMSSGPPPSDPGDRREPVAATAATNNASSTSNSSAVSARRGSASQQQQTDTGSSSTIASPARTLGDPSRRPRSNSSNNGNMPAEFLAAVPHTPLAAATSNPLSTQQLQQAFVQSQQQQIERQRQHFNAQQFPLNKFPSKPFDISPLQPKRQRSYTDPSLEECSAANSVLSMLSKLNPSQLLSSSEKDKERRKESSDEQRKLSGDSYTEEENPDSELSASALLSEESEKKFFVLSNTRPRKNSAPTPPPQAKDESPEDKSTASNWKSDRLLRFYPQSNNRGSQLARKEESSALTSNLVAAQTNTSARRGRADSMGSNSSTGSQNKNRVSANIYETVEARRRRLDRNTRIDQEELEQEQWGVEDMVDSIGYDQHSHGYQAPSTSKDSVLYIAGIAGSVGNSKIQMSSSSNDGDDFAYNFYDEDESKSNSSSTPSKFLKFPPLSEKTISKPAAERTRSASASDAIPSSNNATHKFSIFGNDFNEDD